MDTLHIAKRECLPDCRKAAPCPQQLLPPEQQRGTDDGLPLPKGQRAKHYVFQLCPGPMDRGFGWRPQVRLVMAIRELLKSQRAPSRALLEDCLTPPMHPHTQPTHRSRSNGSVPGWGSTGCRGQVREKMGPRSHVPEGLRDYR